MSPIPLHSASDLSKALESVFRDSLAVSPGEETLIVCDELTAPVAEELLRGALEHGLEAVLVRMRSRGRNGEEPPAAVARAMAAAAVSLLATGFSLTHTEARRAASAAGARIASLPGVTSEMLRRALAIDLGALARDAELAAAALAGEEAHLTAPGGTDLVLRLGGRPVHIDDGNLRHPGSFGNLPAGEVFLAPADARGRVVFDGSLAGFGRLERPIRMEVADGRMVSTDRRELAELLAPLAPASLTIAELGVGLNPRATLGGLVLEDEKVLGTVHLALGDNSSFGGDNRVPVHLDGVILRPTLTVDNRPFLVDGEPRWR